jgi:RNase P/RNase MRP subunit p30
VNPASIKEAKRIVRIAQKLGYRKLGVNAKVYHPSLRQTKGIEVYPVVRIDAVGLTEAKKSVRENSGKLIFARARDASTLRFFSRDSRVWVVELTPRLTKLFDKDEAKLLRLGGSVVGINLSILKKNLVMLGWVQGIIGRTLKYGLKTIVYSGARRAEDLWPPLSILNLLESIGLTKNWSIAMMSNWPLKGVG